MNKVIFKKAKKLFSIIMCIFIICGTFTGCDKSKSRLSDDKINIVCTIYPQYDWVMNLLGDNAHKYNVILLLNNGTDLHSFQPSAEDIVTISKCDLFIYVGGESDAWVTDVIEESANSDMITINMMNILGDKKVEEEIALGMQANGSHDHTHADHSHEDDDEHSHEDDAEHTHEDDAEHTHEDDAEHTEEAEYDEHIWLSLRNAETICNEISDALCKLDSENTALYVNALDSYTDNLLTLDKQYSELVSSSKRTTLLFGDRFPFRYLIEDYNLDYYAAFSGCSADTEASFKTIIYLANKTEELCLPVVCVTEASDQSVALTIANNTKSHNQEVIVLDSIQSVTQKDINNGISYISIMESNLDKLRIALN